MSAMTTLLIKDDAATPEESTLVPVTDTPYPQWRGNKSNIPLNAQMRLQATIDKVKTGLKLSLKLEVPVMETLGASGSSNGYVAPPKVAYTTTMIITMFADNRSTLEDRVNALKLAIGLAQGATSTTGTGTLTQASDWSASQAPIPQFFMNAILPN